MLQLGRPFQHFDARIAGEREARHVVRFFDGDAAFPDLVEARSGEIPKFHAHAVATLPNRVPLTRHAMVSLERAHPASLTELKFFPGRERNDAPRNALTIEPPSGVVELFNGGRDGRWYDVRALAHAHHRSPRRVLRHRAHVVQVSVAHEHDGVSNGSRCAAPHVEHEAELWYLDARFDARNAETFELHPSPSVA